jgi:predicted porin
MMKRKLLPVAIGLAIASYQGQAVADATVYGKANVSTHANNFEYQGREFTDQDTFESNASRLGVKGKAKINDDMNAVFKMEFEVFVDDGDDGSGFSSEFNQRNINGGLSSKKYGTLIGGKNDTPLKMAADGTDMFNDLLLGDINNYMVGENREDNIVIYTTPTWGGFSVTAATMFGEEDGVDDNSDVDAENDDTQDDRIFDRNSVALKYELNDNIWTALSFDNNVQNADIVRFNTSATFGDFTVAAHVQSAEVNNNDLDEDGFKEEEGEGMAMSGSRGLGMVLNDQFGAGDADDNFHQIIQSQDAWMLSAKYQLDKWAFKGQYGQSTSDTFQGYTSTIRREANNVFSNVTGGNTSLLPVGEDFEFEAEQIALGVDYALSKNVMVFGYLAQIEVDMDGLQGSFASDAGYGARKNGEIDDAKLTTGGVGMEVKF